jgi:hypothetical protein
MVPEVAAADLVLIPRSRDGRGTATRSAASNASSRGTSPRPVAGRKTLAPREALGERDVQACARRKRGRHGAPTSATARAGGNALVHGSPSKRAQHGTQQTAGGAPPTGRRKLVALEQPVTPHVIALHGHVRASRTF